MANTNAFDLVDGGLLVTEFTTRQLHTGNIFGATLHLSGGVGAFLDLWLDPEGDKCVKMGATLIGVAPFRVTLFEGARSGVGDLIAIPSYNRNRNYGSSTGLRLWATEGETWGDLIYTARRGSGTAAPVSSGGEIALLTVLNPEVEYRLRVTSLGQSNEISIELLWCEHRLSLSV